MARKNIKNYTTGMRMDRILMGIQTMLAENGATKIMFEYSGDGRVSGISFMIPTQQGDLGIKLPARVERVAMVMYGSNDLNEIRSDQVYRTAWKNISDWVDAQLALLQTEMVRMEEIFLPYMTDPTGETLYERMENRGFLLPEPSRKE